MAQDLTVNIKTTSDVPKAMDKAKAATGSFSKQVEDIGMKFKNSFKDIFLGFTAPMVILQSLIGSISTAIENAKRQAQEGFDLIAKGDTIYANSEEKRFAAYLKARKAMEDEQEAVKKGKIEVTQRFAETPEGGKIGIEMAQKANVAPEGMGAFFGNLATNPEFQKRALEWFLNSPEAKKFETPGTEAEKKAGTFKGPEGFGSVVGVGANPVMEKMTRQNEILEEIKLILQEQSILDRTGVGVPPPFTDRSVPLTAAKEGVA
jgi:hypothetical protein